VATMSFICKIPGCDKPRKHGRSMCSKHSNQWDRHKRILNRTKYDPNEIIHYDDYSDIVLYNDKCIEIARAQVDNTDVESISTHKWSRSSTTGYAVTTVDGVQVGMHNLIMNHSDPLRPIDHKDRNRLNNRRYNLEISTPSENARNSDYYDNIILHKI
jgi:hypothetical protein